MTSTIGCLMNYTPRISLWMKLFYSLTSSEKRCYLALNCPTVAVFVFQEAFAPKALPNGEIVGERQAYFPTIVSKHNFGFFLKVQEWMVKRLIRFGYEQILNSEAEIPRLLTPKARQGRIPSRRGDEVTIQSPVGEIQIALYSPVVVLIGYANPCGDRKQRDLSRLGQLVVLVTRLCV